ncbi:MAG: MBL fold metallo-hydrolase [Desulfobulbus sp.]|nr:MAG: MBL fold metallo-hydrolase [Desulfobulbus sp.]
MTQLNLGDITITWLNGGDFDLDGGTMYGAVPKVLWQQKYPADGDNYIRLLNAPLLVRTPEFNIIIDTGLGNKLTEKQRAIFRVSRPWSVDEDLLALGLNREDIQYVLLTHGDFDHAGGVMMNNGNGVPELTFPKAKHVIQKKEWYDICHPSRRASHSYFPENFSGLKTSGLLTVADGNRQIVEGVAVRLTGGHTRGHQIVEITGSEGSAVHLGDLLPTHTHSNPLWIMAYDNFPLEIIEQKEHLLPAYRQQNRWFTFYHDIYMKACRLDDQGRVVDQIS